MYSAIFVNLPTLIKLYIHTYIYTDEFLKAPLCSILMWQFCSETLFWDILILRHSSKSFWRGAFKFPRFQILTAKPQV